MACFFPCFEEFLNFSRKMFRSMHPRYIRSIFVRLCFQQKQSLIVSILFLAPAMKGESN